MILETLIGRYDIYSSFDEIDELNIISEVNSALSIHVQNVLAEQYLYWYRRGLQPILQRKKDRNQFILNKLQINHAEEIVAFKNGYLLTEPAYYISRTDKQDKVNKLNEYLYRSGKHDVDNKVIDWFHTVGKGVVMVEPNNDPEVPVKAYSLDPRSAFVVYSMRPDRHPVMAVNIVVNGRNAYIDVFTDREVYRLSGSTIGAITTYDPTFTVTASNIESVEPNVLGKIPIIEYAYNSSKMGAFEPVISILDAINNVQSNRVDGVEQFIQSLIVMYNCQLPDGETSDSMKQKGLLYLKSYGENKAEIKILSEQLDQTQTQTLLNDLYQEVLTICAMPNTLSGGKSTSDTGAAVLAREGWYQADAAARNTTDLFKESNRLFDEVFVEILRRKGLLDISISDFELQFIRNETANIQSKAQACQTLLAAGLAPELALYKSGVSNDPEADLKKSEKYLKMIWGDPDDGNKGEAQIIEEDRDNGMNETGGAV